MTVTSQTVTLPSVRSPRRTVMDPQIATMELIHNGAIIQTAGAPAMLVGELRWLLDSAIAWIPAFADRPDDTRLFSFDQVQVRESRIVFTNAGVTTAEIAAISAAVVDDPDDYRVGWQLWLEVAPLRRSFLESCFARVVTGPAPAPTDAAVIVCSPNARLSV